MVVRVQILADVQFVGDPQIYGDMLKNAEISELLPALSEILVAYEVRLVKNQLNQQFEEERHRSIHMEK